MPRELKKIVPVELRSLGLDEKWLQDQISDDPGILGLGELEIAGREHRQPVGGRIDFLLRDPEDETYYEVEVMLGELDASHIIRTIEYWDIERQRRPSFTHHAVIVAEHITSRFFNVLRLLNRAVPMIAVQLSAFPIDNNVVLHPVTVLDVSEETADVSAVDQVEQADRAYWEKKADPASLAVVDKIVAALKTDNVEPRLPTTAIILRLARRATIFAGSILARQRGTAILSFEPQAKHEIPSCPLYKREGSMPLPVGRKMSHSALRPKT
jgi:hypothetical protein